jgi:hypothetical protein
MAEPTKTQTQPDREFDAKAVLDNELESAEDSASPRCPKCGSAKVWRDGNRYSMFGDSKVALPRLRSPLFGHRGYAESLEHD